MGRGLRNGEQAGQREWSLEVEKALTHLGDWKEVWGSPAGLSGRRPGVLVSRCV